MPPSTIRSRIRRSLWLMAIPLLVLGWLLSRPDGPVRFQSYSGIPYRLAADSQLLLTRDGQIMHLPDGQVIQRITAFGQSEFSTNGAFLAVRSQKARVDIIRTADQSVLSNVTMENSDLESLAINATGTFLAIGGSAGTNGTITIYDTRSNRVVTMLPPDGEFIGQLLFTPDDRYLVTFGGKSVRMIDATTWHVMYQTTSLIGPFAFSAPNRLLAINTDRSFALIKIHDGVAQPPRRIPLPYTMSDGFAFSPDGQYLAVIDHSGSGGITLVGTGDGPSHVVRMALVRVADGTVVQRFEGPNGGMANPTFTPDGQQILTIGPGDGVAFWPVAPRESWAPWLRLLPFLGVVLLLLDRLVLWITNQRRRA